MKAVKTECKQWCQMITIYNKLYRDEYELASWTIDSNDCFIMHLKRKDKCQEEG